METKLTNNEVGGVATRFMDPAFFYETLYIGQWYDWKSEDNTHRISTRYGVGYAFQQPVRNRFLLTDQRMMNLDPENPLSAVAQAPSVTLESGFSALAAFEYNGDLSENLTAFVQAFGVSLSKELFGFTCVLAMFIIASTCGYAQEPISGTAYGEKISTTLKTYTLSTAYPLAKSLLGQKIIVTGIANSVTTVSKTPVWFILVDGMTKVAVVNKMTVSTTAKPIGQKVAVVVYGEPIPSSAKVMTLATAMPIAQSLVGTKLSLYGSFVLSSTGTMLFYATSLRIP